MKSLATKGAIGTCRSCGAILISNCGKIKVHHWAHKGNKACDTKKENETAWHRSWKNEFPIDCQEVIRKDEETNEKHIADVQTKHGLVIEFQHSYISDEEQKSREVFYKNMVWVIDGSRSKYDYRRFLKAKDDFTITEKPQVFAVEHIEECFPKNWVNRSVPVVVDFQKAKKYPYPVDIRDKLYCLFPNPLGKSKIIAELSKTAFLNSIKEGKWSERVKGLTKRIIVSDQNHRKEDQMIRDQINQALRRKTPKRPTNRRF